MGRELASLSLSRGFFFLSYEKLKVGRNFTVRLLFMAKCLSNSLQVIFAFISIKSSTGKEILN
jgi:hypothetical protein